MDGRAEFDLFRLRVLSGSKGHQKTQETKTGVGHKLCRRRNRKLREHIPVLSSQLPTFHVSEGAQEPLNCKIYTQESWPILGKRTLKGEEKQAREVRETYSYCLSSHAQSSPASYFALHDRLRDIGSTCIYEGSRDLRPELVRPAVDRLSRGGSRRPVRRGLGKGSSHGSPTHSVDARSRLPRLCRLERP
jgi:hypothetical protein